MRSTYPGLKCRWEGSNFNSRSKLHQKPANKKPNKIDAASNPESAFNLVSYCKLSSWEI